ARERRDPGGRRGPHGAERAHDGAPRRLAHRRGPPPPRPGAELLGRGEPRPARIQHDEALDARLAVDEPHALVGDRSDPGVRRALQRPLGASDLALRRPSAEGRHRAGDDRRWAPRGGMTLDIEPEEGQALAGEAGADDVALTPAARLAGYMRGGGIVVPLLTVVFAFLLAGLVVLITGHNPLTVYKAIFN